MRPSGELWNNTVQAWHSRPASRAAATERSNGVAPLAGTLFTSTTVAVGDKAPALLKLLDMLEDNDDVQKVWSSGDIDDQYLQDA